MHITIRHPLGTKNTDKCSIKPRKPKKAPDQSVFPWFGVITVNSTWDQYLNRRRHGKGCVGCRFRGILMIATCSRFQSSHEEAATSPQGWNARKSNLQILQSLIDRRHLTAILPY
jgi:hypothetical protein